MRPGEETGRPVQVERSGRAACVRAADSETRFLKQERGRLLKVAIDVAPELRISVPREVLDLDAHAVRAWTVLLDGHFLIGLHEDCDAKRYAVVLNWTE